MLNTQAPLPPIADTFDNEAAPCQRMFPKTGITRLILLSSDSLALLTSTLAGLAIAGIFGSEPSQTWHLQAGALIILSLLGLAAANLYPAPGLNPPEEIRLIFLSISSVSATLLTAHMLFQPAGLPPPSVIVIHWLSSLLLIPLGRSIARSFFAQCWWWGTALVVCGQGDALAKTVRELEENPRLGFKVIGRVQDEDGSGVSVDGVADQGSTQARALVESGVNYLLIARNGRHPDEMIPLLKSHSLTFPHVIMLADSVGSTTLAVATRDLGGALGLEMQHKLLIPFYQQLKRWMDLALSITGGLVILPLLAILATLVRMDSPGPVFFRQERIGKNGKPFKVWKFRTMYVDAEVRLQQILEERPDLKAEFEQFHKLRQDPRVTRFGDFLRKSSLDELPQLWNVMRGEMGLVGPRPVSREEVLQMQSARDLILSVRPGITGYWQVSGRNNISYTERVQMELYYVRKWSIWFDLYLLGRTIRTVISGHGAH